MNTPALSRRRGISTPSFFPLIIIGSLCLLLFTAPIAGAQDVPPRPGATDPAANYSRWPDDEII